MQAATLMVHMDTSPEAEARLALAASMARSLDVGLIGVAAGQTAAVGPVQRSNALLAEAREIEQLLHVAGDRFAQTAANLDAASWRAEFADPVAFLALNARAADIVIVGPRPQRSGQTALSIDPEDALIEVGRPILFSPAGLKTWSGECVLVAWKDCKEARRALYEALPLLARAQAVSVVTFNEAGTHDGLADVVAYLEGHGIEAAPHAADVRFGTVGDELLAHAADRGIDMIVAGAFSRSRGQERVFGGVTLDLLQRSAVPVFFAH
jgi:nucleotide-binding universal stress UspA family protein